MEFRWLHSKSVAAFVFKVNTARSVKRSSWETLSLDLHRFWPGEFPSWVLLRDPVIESFDDPAGIIVHVVGQDEVESRPNPA